FPITLANGLKKAGFAVTFLNCRREPTEPGVRAMLDKHIPLLDMPNLAGLDLICKDMGIEVIHSHHAWVDITIAQCLERADDCAHVVTLHGMYEMMEKWELQRLLPIMQRNVDRIVYTAQKN